MGRRCTICNHKHADLINKMLVEGVKYPTLNDLFSVKKSALINHKQKHLPEVLIRSYKARDIATPDALMGKLGEQEKRVCKIADACEDVLRDPKDPSKYRLYTKPADIWIQYTVEDQDGATIYRKGQLIDVLGKLEKKGIKIAHYKIRGIEPPDLLLKAAREFRGYQEILGKLAGLIQDVKINILLHPEWIQLENVLIEVLQKNPGALAEYDQKVRRIFDEDRDQEGT